MRNIIKEPLTAKELKKLAAEVGGLRALVAPKRRAEAEEIPDSRLLAWLAEDGSRLRRPIVVTARQVTVGFAADAKAALERELER